MLCPSGLRSTACSGGRGVGAALDLLWAGRLHTIQRLGRLYVRYFLLDGEANFRSLRDNLLEDSEDRLLSPTK